jgi:anti-sigma B factor antagonist
MPDNEFAARIREQGGLPIIDLQGEVNSGADSALNQAFERASQANPPRLLLNFSGVTYINSTGIALIVGLLAQARKSHIDLLVAGLSDHYRHIFSITRLADFMTIHEDEASALASTHVPGV